MLTSLTPAERIRRSCSSIQAHVHSCLCSSAGSRSISDDVTLSQNQESGGIESDRTSGRRLGELQPGQRLASSQVVPPHPAGLHLCCALIPALFVPAHGGGGGVGSSGYFGCVTLKGDINLNTESQKNIIISCL